MVCVSLTVTCSESSHNWYNITLLTRRTTKNSVFELFNTDHLSINELNYLIESLAIDLMYFIDYFICLFCYVRFS